MHDVEGELPVIDPGNVHSHPDTLVAVDLCREHRGLAEHNHPAATNCECQPSSPTTRWSVPAWVIRPRLVKGRRRQLQQHDRTFGSLERLAGEGDHAVDALGTVATHENRVVAEQPVEA